MAVFPRSRRSLKYNGVRPQGIFEIIRDKLKEHGLLGQSHKFVMASGQLALALYKEDIESALRTPGFGGFQLLDLHDYPGQGTSTVGILDAFWDSKGLTTPAAFRQFCAPTVPLLRLPKRVWNDDETLQVECEVAHYGASDLTDSCPVWSLANDRGVVLAKGQLDRTTIRVGGLHSLGKVRIPLGAAHAPARLVLRLSLKDTLIANDWSLWVYPPGNRTASRPLLTWLLPGPKRRRHCTRAERCLLLAFKSEQLADSIPGVFTTLFWIYPYEESTAGNNGYSVRSKAPVPGNVSDRGSFGLAMVGFGDAFAHDES